MPSGGHREGAGRKPKAEKYERPINKAEKKIADRLPDLVDNLLRRADGGYEVIEESWEPAGTVLIEAHDFDDKGRIVKTKAPAFPNLPPEQLVLIRRKRTIADSDVGANEYLLDRIMGKPVAPQELTGKDGGAIEVEARDGLTDSERARRLAAIFERARARAGGPAEPSEPDLGAAAGPAD